MGYGRVVVVQAQDLPGLEHDLIAWLSIPAQRFGKIRMQSLP